MDSILRHVSPSSIEKRLLSPKQFGLLVSSEGRGHGFSAASILDLDLMYTSLYVCYVDLCKTCSPRSTWTVDSNVEFVSKADRFLCELEICIHKGVPRSKVMRDSIILMIGIGQIGGGTVGETSGSQDWDQILEGKFFDWVGYRALCIGKEILNMTDEMYQSIRDRSTTVDLLGATRNVLIGPLSDMTNRPGFAREMRIARTCFSLAHRVYSIFREDDATKKDLSRVITVVIGEWIVAQ